MRRRDFALYLVFCSCILVSKAIADGTRFLEVVKVDEIKSFAGNFAIQHHEISGLQGKLKEAEKSVRDLQGELRTAEDHEKRRMRAKLSLEERKLRSLKARIEKLARAATQVPHETLLAVRCWDGFAREPLTVLADIDNRKSRVLKAGEIIEAELTDSMVIRARQDGPVSSITDVSRQWFRHVNAMRFSGIDLLQAAPQGFRPFQPGIDDAPWARQPISNTSLVSAKVTDSRDSLDTHLRIRFLAPRDSTNRVRPVLYFVQYKVYALDRNGKRIEDLTPQSPIEEFNLYPFGSDEGLYSYFDPGKRYAWGFEFEVLAAEFYEATAVP